MDTKSCFKCGEAKPFHAFYKSPGMSDGRSGKCKECTKAAVRAHRAKNIERIREYDRRRGNRQSPEYRRRHHKMFPEKYRAKTAVNNAVRDGRLTKPEHCSRCGSTFHIEGHHDDYSKPLDVRWLCAACHKQHHARMREEA